MISARRVGAAAPVKLVAGEAAAEEALPPVGVGVRVAMPVPLVGAWIWPSEIWEMTGAWTAGVVALGAVVTGAWIWPSEI